VGVFAFAQGECGSKVLGEVRGGGDGLEEGLVDLLLVTDLGLGELALLLFAVFLEECLLGDALGARLAGLGEIGIVELLVKL